MRNIQEKIPSKETIYCKGCEGGKSLTSLRNTNSTETQAGRKIKVVQYVRVEKYAPRGAL